MKVTNVIEVGIEKCERAERVIVDSQKRLAERSARIPGQAATVNLDDAAAMEALGCLYLEVAILPCRITANEAVLAKDKSDLQVICDKFICEELGPKARDLEKRARAKARGVLKDHFQAGDQLDLAVEKSVLVKSISASGLSQESNPLGGPRAYASRILAAWEALEAFEAKLK